MVAARASVSLVIWVWSNGLQNIRTNSIQVGC